MAGKEKRRRSVIVDRKFQLGLTLQIIQHVYLYLLLFALFANFDALRTVIFRGETDERYMQAVARLQIFVQVTVIPLVFTFICMCLHGVLFSHRIAGPIYRFKEFLARIRKGDLSEPVHLRDRDFFQDLCGEMNGLLENLRSNLVQFRRASRRVAEQGEELVRSGNLPPADQARLVELANASTQLRQIMDGYRLYPEDTGEAAEPAAGAALEEAAT